jgi:phospho-N-acetylmuramoyl-pentapeptide-transferase
MTVSDAIYMVAGFLLSLGLMLLIMPVLIDYLRKIKFGQSEREEGLESHKAKNGTPTMGGIAFILVPIFVFLLFTLFTPFKLDSNVGIILLAYVGYGLIGFLDDFIIVVRKNNEGLKPWIKLALQSVLAVVFFLLYTRSHETTILIPVVNIYINIGWLYFILVFFMFTAETNAVNFSDGVDGLCAGLMIIALFPFVVFALIQSAYAVAFFILLVIAALAGYLKFNMHPAKVFMGDTGSLALGGLISAVAMVLKEELLLILIGGVFVAELLSVVIQVSHYKRTKKRIFRMAPLHHHFEKGGMPETQVVTGFWVAGAICSLLGLILGVL